MPQRVTVNAHKGTCFRQHVVSRPTIQSMGGECGFLRRQPDFILATAVLLAWDPVKGSFLLHWGLVFSPSGCSRETVRTFMAFCMTVRLSYHLELLVYK